MISLDKEKTINKRLAKLLIEIESLNKVLDTTCKRLEDRIKSLEEETQ